MIQGAVAVTLVPRLRVAGDVAGRRRLLMREAGLMLIVMLAGSALIWLLAPALARLLLNGRYELSNPLMLATIISGVLKVVSALAIAAASTLAPARSLRWLSVGSWACIVIAVAAAVVAARWGLVGVLYGISFGWLVRCAVATAIALPHLRHPRAAR